MSNYKMDIYFNINKSNNDIVDTIVDKISIAAKKRYFNTSYKNGVLKICGTGKSDDFANMGVIISALKRKTWFALNIYKWLFYDSENTVEDLYQRYNLNIKKEWKQFDIRQEKIL